MNHKPYIKLLDIYYGAKCNLACNQCDTHSDIIRTRDDDPSLEEIFEGISLAQKHFEIDLYSVLGGEPLLYLDKIDQILTYIRQTDPNAKILFSTNGLLLSKKAEELAALMTKHSASLFVCNHFAGFDPVMTKNISQGVDKLVALLGMQKDRASIFFKELLGFDNKRNDPIMAQWVLENAANFSDEQSPDQYFHNEEIFVHFRPQYDFKKNHYLENGKPKPFKTNDPERSYKNGCSSVMCNFLINKKLYKCSALGTLDKLLKAHGSTDDPVWQKYRNYKPLDLERCTVDEVERFSNTKMCAISECDMCGTDNFLKTRETVIYIRQQD